MNILLEPGFFLSAAAVLAAIFVPLLFISRKNFSYRVLYDALFESAVESEGETQPDEETSTDEVRVVTIEFRNSSGLNIERTHYERPITVGFGEGARIVSAEVIEEKPPAIEASLRGLPEFDPDRVAIDPVLLNDGDLLLLEIAVANAAYGGVEVDGRIVGIKEVVDRSQSHLERNLLVVNVGVLFVVVALAGVADVAFQILRQTGVDPFDPLIVSIAGGIVAGSLVSAILLLYAIARRFRRASWIEQFVRSRYFEAEKSQ